MNILDILNRNGCPTKKVTALEHSSACPYCNDGDDRFRSWPAEGKSGGTSWCRHCDKKPDAIQLLRDLEKKSYTDACDELGIEPRTYKKTTPSKNYRKQPEVKVASKIEPYRKDTRETIDPPEGWLIKASKFTCHTNLALKCHYSIVEMLYKRGIKLETAELFELGYNDCDHFRTRPQWGLPADSGTGKDLYLPKGLVIPHHNQIGFTNRLRIRKDELKNKDDARYIVVGGSNMTPFVIPCKNKDRFSATIVIESELDAILISQEAGDFVTVVAMGNSSAKPDKATEALFRESPLILNALDYDAAGAKAFLWWENNYKQVKRWPVPEGGDPGEYVKDHGGNIREWLIAGLPRGLHPYEIVARHIENDDTGPALEVEPEPNHSPLNNEMINNLKTLGYDMSPLVERECNHFDCKKIVWVGSFNRKPLPKAWCKKHTDGMYLNLEAL